MKYPKFKDELDLEALEHLLYQLVKAIGRKESAHGNNFLAGLLYRCSPYFRRIVETRGHALGNDLKTILPIAHWKDWDGEEE